MSVASEKPRPTLDQQRARHAWEAVLREKRQGDHERQDPKKFGGQAKKLPVRIMASGLGQAIVFLKAKDYAPGLVAEISDWIATRVPLRPDEPRETGPTPRSAGENHPGRLGFSPPRDRRGVGLPAMAPPLCRSGGIDRRRRRMTATVPLPTAIQAVLAGNTHPGLLLDKYVRSWDAERGRAASPNASRSPRWRTSRDYHDPRRRASNSTLFGTGILMCSPRSMP